MLAFPHGPITSLLLYAVLCAAALATGLGLLRLLRLDVDDASRFLLAPAVGLVFWSLALGIVGGLRIPVKHAWAWLWGATALLALGGLPWPRSAVRADGPLLGFCAALPLVVMAPYFWNGLGDHVGSVLPDGWSYVAAGQYFWEFEPGFDASPTPLYKYALHLSRARYVSSELLAFLSPLVRAGDTQAVSSLFQAWALFTTACAVGFFGVAFKLRTWMIAAAVGICAGGGWMANAIWANNFDNQLGLVYMPLFAGIVRRAPLADRRWSLLLGCLLGGLVYSYPELAPASIGGALLIALPHLAPLRKAWRLGLQQAAGACLVAAILLLPGAPTLVPYIRTQFESVSASRRPGEGLFAGLTLGRFQPAAFWGLGGEHQISRDHRARNALGAALSALALIGLAALAARGEWGLAAAAIIFALGALWFAVGQRYSYGAYKLILVNWWCLSIALVAGIDWLATRVRRPPLRGAVATALALLIALALWQRHTDAAATVQYLDSPNRRLTMAQFRRLGDIREIVGEGAVVVLVDDWLANQWAVYYLREVPARLAALRAYMALPHLVPLMQGGPAVDPRRIRYALTDSTESPETAARAGWKLRWSSPPYALWEIPPFGPTQSEILEPSILAKQRVTQPSGFAGSEVP